VDFQENPLAAAELIQPIVRDRDFHPYRFYSAEAEEQLGPPTGVRASDAGYDDPHEPGPIAGPHRELPGAEVEFAFARTKLIRVTR
jgi:hypothetical protein